MSYRPRDIVNYIHDNDLDIDMIMSVTNQVQNFSIGEITDKEIVKRNGSFYLVSKSYALNMEIVDDEILTAVINRLYVSAFISRNGDSYNIHFLVHKYPESMKERFEDEITKEVIDYIILGTVKALRLDTPEKVKAYIS